MLKPFRRVVTGHNAEGKSTVVFDGVAQQCIENPLWPGRGATGLWRTDKSMSDNLGNEDPAGGRFRLQPIDGGTNFLIAHVMPSSDLDAMTPEQRERIYKETMHAVGTPEARVDTLKHPGTHKTKTIDYLVVLSGEVTLLLEDGEVDLRPLDGCSTRYQPCLDQSWQGTSIHGSGSHRRTAITRITWNRSCCRRLLEQAAALDL